MSSLMTHFWFLSVCFLREKEEGSYLCACVLVGVNHSRLHIYTHTMPDRTIKQSDYTPIVQLQIHFLFKLDAHPTALLILPKTKTALFCCHTEVPFVVKMALLGKIWTFSVWSRLACLVSLGISFSLIVPTIAWPDVHFLPP